MAAGLQGQTPGQRQHNGIAEKEREVLGGKWKNGHAMESFSEEQYM